MGSHQTPIENGHAQALHVNADAYTAAQDEASAYRLLVERVETLIAEKQQLFWQSQAKGGAQQEPPKLPDQGA